MNTPQPSEPKKLAPPLAGRSLVALSLLVLAPTIAICWIPLLYSRSLFTGQFVDTLALVFMGTAVVILLVVAAALFLVGSIRWALADRWYPLIRQIHDQTHQTNAQLQLVADRILISETAKRITYRSKDRQALREAIEEDLNKGDFDAALVLVNDMSKVYGYTIEAEQFRDRIESSRQASLEKRINEAMMVLDGYLQQAEWDKASAEAARIQRMFPDSPKVRDLPKRVKDAWQERKHELERQLLQSASHDDVEGSMDLLRELDRYLTPQEAAPFLEVARGVIGKKRQNLGVQFKLAIQDKEWTQAVAVGEQIIREFPNTKMADEVRSTIDILRERAAGQRAAERQDTPVSTPGTV